MFLKTMCNQFIGDVINHYHHNSFCRVGLLVFKDHLNNIFSYIMADLLG